MPQDRYLLHIRDSAVISAPLARAFALSTSVPLVRRTLGFTPVEGVTEGVVVMGSRVLWRGWLFGLPQRHLTLITGYQPPHRDANGTERAWFQDTQEAGRFQFFQHDHHMTAVPGDKTLLQDEIRFSLPFGWAGFLVAKFILQPFIGRTLRSRFALLGSVAQSGQWREYVPD